MLLVDGQGAMQVVLHGVAGAQGESDNDVHYGMICGGVDLGKGESDEGVTKLVSKDKPELDSSPATEAGWGHTSTKCPALPSQGPTGRAPSKVEWPSD